jgi:hypothetical protein
MSVAAVEAANSPAGPGSRFALTLSILRAEADRLFVSRCRSGEYFVPMSIPTGIPTAPAVR